MITEPELAKEILTNKEGIFPKIKSKGHVKKLIGDGLVMAEGSKWLKLRKLANHAFYAESLKVTKFLSNCFVNVADASME